ncbi:hypothetical protein CN326_12025 [Bacillus sp. AFS018417]|nr:hypothetical protein CN326_12025 [Bacillus sp. AFS018417]
MILAYIFEAYVARIWGTKQKNSDDFFIVTSASVFLSYLSRGLPPLNVREGGEVNRKSASYFQKIIETYVPSWYNLLKKEVKR